MEALVVSTKRAAEAMRLEHLVGTLEVGKEADLLLLGGDPQADMRVLSDVKNLALVMQGGRGVSGQLTQEMAYRPLENMNFLSIPPSRRSW